MFLALISAHQPLLHEKTYNPLCLWPIAPVKACVLAILLRPVHRITRHVPFDPVEHMRFHGSGAMLMYEKYGQILDRVNLVSTNGANLML